MFKVQSFIFNLILKSYMDSVGPAGALQRLCKRVNQDCVWRIMKNVTNNVIIEGWLAGSLIYNKELWCIS